MNIHLATDHAGFAYKEVVKNWLTTNTDHTVTDHGAYELNEDDDYPDFVKEAATAVSMGGDDSRGIIFGGTGNGEAMVANRMKGIRTAVYYGGSKQIVTLSRTHNNANVLSLGARFLTAEEMLEVVELWLATDFEGEERHQRRISKFDI